jgi:hypothetical protein
MLAFFLAASIFATEIFQVAIDIFQLQVRL